MKKIANSNPKKWNSRIEQKSSQKSYLKMGSLPYSYHYYSTSLAEPSLFLPNIWLYFPKKSAELKKII
jgi:hypothetical protein